MKQSVDSPYLQSDLNALAMWLIISIQEEQVLRSAALSFQAPAAHAQSCSARVVSGEWLIVFTWIS